MSSSTAKPLGLLQLNQSSIAVFSGAPPDQRGRNVAPRSNEAMTTGSFPEWMRALSVQQRFSPMPVSKSEVAYLWEQEKSPRRLNVVSLRVDPVLL